MVSALSIYKGFTEPIHFGQAGQLSMTNIIGFLMLIVVLASILPTLTTFINITKNSTNAEVDVLLDLIPLFLVLAVIMTLFLYARPHYAG